MKLMLDPLSETKAYAEEQIDRIYAHRVSEIVGPMGMVHILKRLSIAADGGLADDEADAAMIALRAKEQDGALAAVDRERRAVKATIRSAQTSEEVLRVVETARRASA